MAQGLTAAQSPLTMMYLARRRRGLSSAPLAWTVSIGIHAAIFAALWKMVYREAPPVRRLVIPEARLAPVGSPAGEPSASARDPVDSTAPSPVPGGSFSGSLSSPLPQIVPAASLEAMPVVAVALPSRGGEAGAVLNAGIMMPSGGLSEPADGMTAGARTSGPSLVGSGPSTRFFGQGGSAYKVVYVIDVSASLMIYMNDIIQETRQSIEGLVPTQQFHIVLARPGQVQPMQPERLVPAIARYKKQAGAFLDAIGQPQPGKADPIEAMRRAFSVEPELIYFLSDGDYLNIQDELQKVLAQLNARGEVKITTLCFSTSSLAQDLLTNIARRHGGHFRVVQFKE